MDKQTFFQNKECPYFPCHKVENTEHFNCMFCYCPLYALGKNCGGNFTYTDAGIKDCSACALPHMDGGYQHICKHLSEIITISKE